jgi:hypothetical protein
MMNYRATLPYRAGRVSARHYPLARRSRSQKNRNISRKDAKGAKERRIVISTKGRNLSHIPCIIFETFAQPAKILNQSSTNSLVLIDVTALSQAPIFYPCLNPSLLPNDSFSARRLCRNVILRSPSAHAQDKFRDEESAFWFVVSATPTPIRHEYGRKADPSLGLRMTRARFFGLRPSL